MNIVCAQCNATYTISDKKIPAKRAFAKCKKCGGRIAIEPGSNRPDSVSRETVADYPASDTGGAVASKSSHPDSLLQDYPELRAYSPAAYRFASILVPNKKGGFKNRRNTLKTKILRSVKTLLDKMLKEDERVLHIAAATAYYPLEILLGNGWLTMLYNRYALVATNHRMIMINTNHRMTKPAHYLFQMLYAELKKVKRGLFRTSLLLERKRGKRRIFTGMKSYMSAELHKFVQDHIDPQAAIDDEVQVRDHICPACFEPLPAALDACNHCRAAFKTPQKAMIRSLLLPGWGDIYLGHRLLGCLELTGSLMVWLIVIVLAASGDFAAAAFLLIICNGLDALLTRHMARKGYILEKRQERMPLQAAHSPA